MSTLGSILLLFVNIAGAQDSLTVEQAVQQVLKIHPAIEQALANTRAAEALVRRKLRAPGSQMC